MKRSIQLALIMSLVLALLLAGTACSSSAESEVPKISVQAVKTGDLLIGQYADGRVVIPSTEIQSPVAGIIAEVLVQPGQPVAAGETLARLDPAELESELAAAELAVKKAEESLNEAKLQRAYTISSEEVKLVSLEREIYDSRYKAIEDYNQQILKIDYLKNSDLAVTNAEIALEQAEEAFDDNPTTVNELAIDKAGTALEEAIQARDYNIALEEQKLLPIERAYLEAQADIAKDPVIYTEYSQNYDMQKLKVDYLRQSDAAVTTAQFALADAQARLAAAQAALAQVEIKAPVAGIVKSVAVEPRDLVAAATASSTSSLLSIAQTEMVQVTANITETDIAGIEVGQTMRITVDALTLENQAGSVSEISLTPKIDSTGIVTYLVTGTFTDPDARILDGMTTFVTFIKKEKPDVLLVSNKAVYIKDAQQYVTVQKEDDTLEERAVTCGLTNGTVSEVIEGLAAGEKVVTGGLER
ncbi:MAG: efflux RND transporter periplasmic adaptor subunit [Clostridia bacterium]|nr:efflux RND transporter periplasmic adaptor subunit [Clostridia bacterium]